jgi:hypothetical protein
LLPWLGTADGVTERYGGCGRGGAGAGAGAGALNGDDTFDDGIVADEGGGTGSGRCLTPAAEPTLGARKEWLENSEADSWVAGVETDDGQLSSVKKDGGAVDDEELVPDVAEPCIIKACGPNSGEARNGLFVVADETEREFGPMKFKLVVVMRIGPPPVLFPGIASGIAKLVPTGLGEPNPDDVGLENSEKVSPRLRFGLTEPVCALVCDLTACSCI